MELRSMPYVIPGSENAAVLASDPNKFIVFFGFSESERDECVRRVNTASQKSASMPYVIPGGENSAVLASDQNKFIVFFGFSEAERDECVRRVNTASRKSASIADLADAVRSLLAWVDAVPQELPLPAMPGIDRDWIESLLHSVEEVSR